MKPGDEGDKVTALKAAIKTLIDFISKGGQVDCVLPQIATPTDGNGDGAAKARQELQETFKEIRQLEDRQRLLKHHPTD